MDLLFPKENKKRKRKQHKASVLQNKDGICFLCMLLDGDFRPKWTEEHHIFYGSANRALSEAYGLKVYLCSMHHQYAFGNNPDAIHGNPTSSDTDLMLKRIAQRKFEEDHTREDFVKIFGKNYL